MDRQPSAPRAGHRLPAGTSGAADEAAEFAEYLRAERERRRAVHAAADSSTAATQTGSGSAGKLPGGMFRRAMMRAYAESIGVDPELALKDTGQPLARQTATAAAAASPRVPVAADPPHPVIAPPVPVVAGPPRRAHAAVEAPRQTRPPQLRRSYSTRQFGTRYRVRLLVRSAKLLHAGAAFAAFLVIAVAIWGFSGTENLADPASGPAVLERAAPQPIQPATAATAPQAVAAATAGSPAPARTSALVTPSAPATEGTLVIASDPPGARVTVNGIGWGETPATIRHLEFGPKRIRLTMPGYVSQERTAHLSPGQPSARARVALKPRRR